MPIAKRIAWAGLAGIAVALSAPVLAKSFSSLVFTETDPEAIVMVEEMAGLDAGQMLFERFDPEAVKFGGGSFLLRKDVWLGRLKTKYADLQDFGLPSFFAGYSRFSAIKRPAGVYAFTLHEMTTGPDTGTQCPKAAVPVFRFKPGIANLVPNAVLPMGGHTDFTLVGPFFNQKAPANYQGPGTADPRLAAQRVLDERPGIKARVEYAEFLGYVAWQNDKGEISGCYHTKKLVWLTEEIMRTAKIRD